MFLEREDIDKVISDSKLDIEKKDNLYVVRKNKKSIKIIKISFMWTVLIDEMVYFQNEWFSECLHYIECEKGE